GYYGKQQFREDFGLDLGNNTWSNYSFVGFNLSVPIFNGFAYRNKLKISKIDLNLSEIELNKANLESHSQDIKLVEEYRTSISNTKLALEAFQLYEENERLALQKYSEGVISLDRYFNAFEDYLKSENAYLNGLLTTYSLYSQIIPRVQ
ncbi:MAG: TolC family protein, partial [Bacteroidia bacterium]|nr:TolC family protein [Bacteroidia bacterium]